MIHEEGDDAFFMQSPDHAHGGIAMAYHIGACGFPAGRDEFLHGLVMVPSHHDHAWPWRRIELSEHGGKKLP